MQIREVQIVLGLVIKRLVVKSLFACIGFLDHGKILDERSLAFVAAVCKSSNKIASRGIFSLPRVVSLLLGSLNTFPKILHTLLFRDENLFSQFFLHRLWYFLFLMLVQIVLRIKGGRSLSSALRL
jgi:hypothetical protein